MANQEKQQIVTKKHMARQEREALQVRYLTYGTVGLLVVVAILVGYALINAYFIVPNKPVAIVDGVEITTKDYQTRVKFERYQMINQMINTANMMFSFGSDPDTQAYFESSLQQMRFQLTPQIHGQTVLDTMIEDELILQEADRLGLTVSDEEIDKFIAEAFGYYPDGTPTPFPTSEPLPTPTFTSEQLTLVPSTEEEGESTDTEITPTEIPPTATPYTEDAFQEDYKNSMNAYKQSTGISEKDFRKIIGMGILREKVFEEVTKDVPAEEAQVWARHILVETEEEANEVISRLDAGEDFAELAQELSLDTGSGANGGDLGWFGYGQMVGPFETAAFALKDGEISIPIQTQFGWHVIQKLGFEVKPADEVTHNQLKQTYFDQWLEDQRNSSKIETFDIWMEVYPEVPAIPEGL